MKRILQIFSVLLFACLAVVIFGVLSPQKAHATDCNWVNSGQIDCGRTNYFYSPYATSISHGDYTFAVFVGGKADDQKIVFVDMRKGASGTSVQIADPGLDPSSSELKTSVNDIGDQGNRSNDAPGDDCSINKPYGCNQKHNDSDASSIKDGSYSGVFAKPTDTAIVAKLDAFKGNAATLSDTDSKSACVESPLSFFLCPISDFVTEVIVGLLDNIKKILVAPSLTGDIGAGSNLDKAVGSIRNIANTTYALIFLFIILANFIAIPGLDNYTIKKLLPKLIFVIIVTQFAFLICGAIIDIGNIIGQTVPNTVALAYSGGQRDANTLIAEAFNPFESIKDGINQGNAGQIIGGILQGIAAWFFALVLFSVALVIIFIAFCYLIFRYLALVILIVISPLALAAWVLPNTEGFTKWWITNFFKMVLIYPMFMMLLVIAAIASEIFKTTGGPIGVLISIAMPIFALALIPKIFKWSGGLVASAGKIASESRGGKAASGAAKSAIKKSSQEGKLAEEKGKALSSFGKGLGGKRGIKMQARGEQLKREPSKVLKERIGSLPLKDQIAYQTHTDKAISGGAKAAVAERRRDLANTRILDAQQQFDMAVLNGSAPAADASGKQTMTFTNTEGNTVDIVAENGRVNMADNPNTFFNPNFSNTNGSPAPTTVGGAQPAAGGAGAPAAPPTTGAGGGTTTPAAPPTRPPRFTPPTPPAGGAPPTPPTAPPPPAPPSSPPPGAPPTMPGGFT